MHKATQERYLRRDSQIATLWDHWNEYVSVYAQTGLSFDEASILKRNLQALCQRINPYKQVQADYYEQMKILVDLQVGTTEALLAMAIRSRSVFTQDDIGLLRLISKQITPDDILFCLVFLTYDKMVEIKDSEYFAKSILPKCGLARSEQGNYPLLANALFFGKPLRHMVSFLLTFIQENTSCTMSGFRLNELYRSKANAVAVFGGLFSG